MRISPLSDQRSSELDQLAAQPLAWPRCACSGPHPQGTVATLHISLRRTLRSRRAAMRIIVPPWRRLRFRRKRKTDDMPTATVKVEDYAQTEANASAQARSIALTGTETSRAGLADILASCGQGAPSNLCRCFRTPPRPRRTDPPRFALCASRHTGTLAHHWSRPLPRRQPKPWTQWALKTTRAS